MWLGSIAYIHMILAAIAATEATLRGDATDGIIGVIFMAAFGTAVMLADSEGEWLW